MTAERPHIRTGRENHLYENGKWAVAFNQLWITAHGFMGESGLADIRGYRSELTPEQVKVWRTNPLEKDLEYIARANIDLSDITPLIQEQSHSVRRIYLSLQQSYPEVNKNREGGSLERSLVYEYIIDGEIKDLLRVHNNLGRKRHQKLSIYNRPMSYSDKLLELKRVNDVLVQSEPALIIDF